MYIGLSIWFLCGVAGWFSMRNELLHRRAFVNKNNHLVLPRLRLLDYFVITLFSLTGPFSWACTMEPVSKPGR